MLTQKIVNDVAYRVVGCAIEVHKGLGPGLLESVYHECMLEELAHNGIKAASQVRVPLYWRGRLLKGVLVQDIVVEDCVIVELKACEAMPPVYKAQLLSYPRLTGKPKGLLINFHVENIVQHAVHLVSYAFARLRVS